jgi:hypothetical protein
MRKEPFLLFTLLLLGCDALPYELDLGGDETPTAAASVTASPAATAAPVATAPAASASPKRKPPEPAPGPVVDITADAITAVTSSSEQTKFLAKNLFDHDAKTAWVEASPSDGEGHWVEVALVPGTFVSHVEVSAGWAHETRFKEDLWEINTSVRVMKVSWDGGEDTVSFQRSTDRGKKKKLEIGARTSKLRFTAEAVAVGKFEELAIDDHNLFGVLGR